MNVIESYVVQIPADYSLDRIFTAPQSLSWQLIRTILVMFMVCYLQTAFYIHYKPYEGCCLLRWKGEVTSACMYVGNYTFNKLQDTYGLDEDGSLLGHDALSLGV
jgi:hypothetical protein